MHTVCIGLIVIADVLKSGLPEDGIENILSSGWYRLTTGNWNELCIKYNGTKMNITQYYDTWSSHHSLFNGGVQNWSETRCIWCEDWFCEV